MTGGVSIEHRKTDESDQGRETRERAEGFADAESPEAAEIGKTGEMDKDLRESPRPISGGVLLFP